MYSENDMTSGTPMPDNPIILPGWFIKVATAVTGLLLPWAAWVTLTLATMNVKIDVATRAEDKVDSLRNEFIEHISDPTLHASGISQVTSQVELLSKRIERLESK